MQTKPLSWDQIRANAAAFVHEWAGESYERGESQSFWTDLFAVYGVRRRAVARFEARARKADGGAGFIDVFWPGMLIAEQKSLGKDLVAAEDQALTYLANVPEAEQPRYVITCDFETFRLRDLEAAPGDEDAVVEFPLEQLPVEAERFGFIAGYQKRTFGSAEQAAASVKAAQLMADLYVELEGSGYDEHEASVFLVRTLFALFADDSGLWERDLFLEFIQTRTAEDGSDLGAQLTALFQVLNRPVNKRMTGTDELMLRFPYVNGSVFGEPLSIPYFTASMREKLIAACLFNWGSISPAIFGSLFQAVKSKEARRELGEHYTTEENILKLIGPLFLDELRAEFVANIHSRPGLRKLHERLGQMRFLDPACGCGNFLIVAYRELRALELQILVRLQELSGKQAQTSLVMDEDERVRVRMSHFNGIELEEWPATIARTAMFLVDHQANQDMSLKIGVSPEQLPLTESAHIVVGNALELDWNEVLAVSDDVRVMGNPPFIGARRMTSVQKEEINALWPRGKAGLLDYCAGWHAKTADYLEGIQGARFAFVTTNSIAQGQQVSALFPDLLGRGWQVLFAHRTFTWTSEAPDAAAVHCVIVGMGREPDVTRPLFSYKAAKGAPEMQPVAHISPYLIAAPDLFVSPRSKPLSAELPPAIFGSMANDDGNLLLDTAGYAEAMADPWAAKYVRKFVGARELVHDLDRWCLWLVDVDPEDVARSAFLRNRIERTREYRSASKRAATQKLAATAHLFGERRAPTVDYLCIPRHVSENRLYFTAARFDPEVISGDANFVVPDPDGFAFAVISTSAFIAWQRMVGGQIKSDRVKLIEAGAGVLAVRAEHPERSLAQHYNPLAMDPALLKAHTALDKVMDGILGIPVGATEKERQTRLMELYAARV
ncbi:DNA methyltransferase [uncultured Micrococcus sp.]|uniref:DNA methyltransferase n=1 Tax=uncultured Micrococcus sp. TaxID=114051 RepID=UPI0025D147AC|nr:DNA methyltransferase [uncultured Micrococcus sp.]